MKFAPSVQRAWKWMVDVCSGRVYLLYGVRVDDIEVRVMKTFTPKQFARARANHMNKPKSRR